MTTRETSFREIVHPGIVFLGNVLSGKNDHPGNDFPGNVFAGEKPSGEVTIRETTVNLGQVHISSDLFILLWHPDVSSPQMEKSAQLKLLCFYCKRFRFYNFWTSLF